MNPEQHIWLQHYPPGVPQEVDCGRYPSMVALLDESLREHAQRTACTFIGRHLGFHELDGQSRALAAWLQSVGLRKGERMALILPNFPQYPVGMMALWRAGLVLVNVNPMCTASEMQAVLNDSGAAAVLVDEHFAATLQQCIGQTRVKHVLLASAGDLLGVRGQWLRFVERRFTKRIKPYHLPGALRFNAAVAEGRLLEFTPPEIFADDLAVLQYTGGTTGVSKAAMLTHRNLVANLLQNEAWSAPVEQMVGEGVQVVSVCALPLYHVFGFMVGLGVALKRGWRLILIPDPQNITRMLGELGQETFHCLPGVNTLYSAILRHPDFDKVNWRNLRACLGGGMAVQATVAMQWQQKTGCVICEGYGLSEASPSVSCNLLTLPEWNGTIGIPLPSTEIKIVDDGGAELPAGAAGEIVVRGPQVMPGYWGRPDETANVMLPDGFMRTGDIGVMDTKGYFRLIDRKKEIILVGGFNVYPNEVEQIISQLAGVIECAVIGIPDPESGGEHVKAFVVRSDGTLTERAIIAHCHTLLTRYKCPHFVEFCESLPRSRVGKVLRRVLREAQKSRSVEG